MKLVQKSKRNETKTDVRRIILATIGVAGILVAGAVAPNIFSIIPELRKLRKYYANNAFERLITRKWVKFENDGEHRYLVLTPEGRRQLILHEIRQEYQSKKIQKWDKKWRILIFDIKENARVRRNQMRSSLGELGFVRLQNSVWVYPYDCENLLFLLKTYYGFGGNVLYILADKVENDKHLRDHFGL